MHMPAAKQPQRPSWFHPILFAVFPALSMLAANVDQVPLSQGFRILAVSLLVGVLVYLLARLVLRRWGNAALAASLILIVMLSYGRLYDGLKAVGLSGETLVRHRYLLPVYAIVAGAGIVWCARRREAATWNRVLNVVSVIAVAFPLAVLGSALAQSLSPGRLTQAECSLQPPASQPLPDVYVIIMDAYERDDVLREFHSYDNSPFLNSLEDMGFYVAYGSLSNYRHTELSLSSMLNMEYTQDFPERFGARPRRVQDVTELIRNSQVRRELECLGYLTVAFETGHIWTEWRDADYFLQRGNASLGATGIDPRINRLEYMFLETTLARVALDGWMASEAAKPPSALGPTIDVRDRVLFVFDQLAIVPTLPSPKLAFVHILSPHPPFVFGPDGEPVSAAEFETASPGPARDDPLLQAYADQVTYLNKRLLQAIEAILAVSETRPIILLMGDHGWADRNMEDKLSILNAYFVPPDAAAELDQTITPVNSFRMIFDSVFGGSYGQLPNVSYFSTEEEFEFVIVPNTWASSLP
jgi:hypothetical protein